MRAPASFFYGVAAAAAVFALSRVCFDGYMEIAGSVLALGGAALFLVALALTLRANTDRVPFSRNPVISPRGAILMRSIGMGLVVLASAALVPTIGYWSIAPVVVVAVVAVLSTALHNRRVAFAQAERS